MMKISRTLVAIAVVTAAALLSLGAWTTPKTWSAAVLTSADMNTYVRDNQNFLKTSVNDSGAISFVDATELTISSGVVTVTGNYHSLDGEGDSNDDLDTITAGTNVVAGHLLVLRSVNDARDITITETGNVDHDGTVALDNTEDTAMFIYDGSTWLLIEDSNNGS